MNGGVAITPVERTRLQFLASFEVLYPGLGNRTARKQWSDLRTRVEIEEIADLAKAMSRVARSALVRQQVTPGEIRRRLPW